MKAKVVFIAGAGHSGSTMLETLISGSSNVVGLGEIFQLIDRRNPIIDHLGEHKCSCGQTVMMCPFWEKTVAAFQSIPLTQEVNRYNCIIDNFREEYGLESVAVDSSKVPEALEFLSQSNSVDVRVIHLVRDVRAWIVSMQNSYRRNNVSTLMQNWHARGVLRGSLKYIHRSTFADAHYWTMQNKRVEAVVKRNSLKSMMVSYERLCFDTAKVKQELEGFLNIQIPEYGSRGFNHANHSIFGNRMRFEPEKLAHIRYDHKWFSRRDWVMPWLLLPHTNRLNNKYCNFKRV